jgi:Putative peptidoglycan binding domain.
MMRTVPASIILAVAILAPAHGESVDNHAVILRVEERLEALGYPVTRDGEYDANLRNNLMRYQSEHGLRPTGDVDLSTIGALGIALEPVDRPEETARTPERR